MEGFEFVVRATEERFLELMRNYLAPFRVEEAGVPALDANVYVADCGVEKVLPGGRRLRPMTTLYLDSLRIFRGAAWEEMAGRLISSVRDMVTHHSNEFVRVRAAGVTLDGHALILPSLPSPHLPALSALLLRGGARYLGDEIVNIDPILQRAHGMALPLLVDSSDFVHLPDLAARRPRGGRKERGDREARTPRRPVTLKDLGAAPAPPHPVGWIVFPSFQPGAPTELRPVARAEAVFLFSQALLNLHIWTDRALVLARELLESAWAGKLIVGSLPEAADVLRTGLPGLTGGQTK
ncbi:MAG TPA: hypothetical protein VGR49_04920 [Actinomycetota bacterium]|nr:hypothetical protein [Actinomycetota bacterium]